MDFLFNLLTIVYDPSNHPSITAMHENNSIELNGKFGFQKVTSEKVEKIMKISFNGFSFQFINKISLLPEFFPSLIIAIFCILRIQHVFSVYGLPELKLRR
jgi:hypothetical protein